MVLNYGWRVGRKAVKVGGSDIATTSVIRGGREPLEAGIRMGAGDAAEKVVANGTKNAIGDTANVVKGTAIQEGILQPAVTQGKKSWKTAFFGSKYVQVGGGIALAATGVATAVAIGKGGDDLLEGMGDAASGAGTLMEHAPLAIGAGVVIVGIYYLSSS